MDEGAYRSWDLGLKVVGLPGVAVGAAFTYWQYFDGAKRQEKTAALEAIKPFLAERQTLYGEAIRAAATLATSKDPADLSKSGETFWRLYWGPLATVESREIEALMVRMGQCLRVPNAAKLKSSKLHSIWLIKSVQETASGWSVYLPNSPGQK